MDKKHGSGKTNKFICCSTLSASELFKYRKQSDRSIPNVGGSKEFQSDGSWLQAKKLETFYRGRKELLSEQRVERVGNLVCGEWNPEKQLVELHKELGKFWVYMGFVDNSRKWLYPEEALYLMETNMMEVRYRELPLSIQQAYRSFLGGCLTLERYQVYAHLRRLGYVLIRHQGRLNISQYGRRINLDQHVKLQKRKEKKRKAKVQTDALPQKKMREDGEESGGDCNSEPLFSVNQPGCNIPSTQSDTEMDCLTQDGLDFQTNLPSRQSNTEVDRLPQDSPNLQTNIPSTHSVTEIDRLPQDTLNFQTMVSSSSSVRCSTIQRDDVISYRMKSLDKAVLSKIAADFSRPVGMTSSYSISPCSRWNFSQILFPDIGKDTVVTLTKSNIRNELFPPNVSVPDIYTFDKEKYNQKFSVKITDFDQEELEYSFPSGQHIVKNIKAKNWTEYKAKLREIQADNDQDISPSPVGHLWRGEITPLVRPREAISVDAVLEKLQIIKSLELPLIERHDEMKTCKVLYDVYLPDAKFKKSNPGRPDHRLCVLRHGDPVPDVYSLSVLQQHYSDGIPIHWAVVDHGDIAFYSFTDFNVPVLL